MGITFIVDSVRFEKEYRIRIGSNKNENVEWYVDRNTLHAYIVTPGKVYYYSTGINNIPASLKGLFIPNGEVRGIIKNSRTIEVSQNPNIEKLKLNFNEHKE